MANIHNLNVYIDDAGVVYPNYGVQPVDLECSGGGTKKVMNILYDISGAPVIVHNESPNTKWFTAIYDCYNTNITVVDNPI